MTTFRGSVKKRYGMWTWKVTAFNDKKIAGGEEFEYSLALLSCLEATWAANVWLMYGRVNLLKYKPRAHGAREFLEP